MTDVLNMRKRKDGVWEWDGTIEHRTQSNSNPLHIDSLFEFVYGGR